MRQKRKKKRVSKAFNHVTFVVQIAEQRPDLLGAYTFSKKCPFEVTLPKLRAMSFKKMDAFFERYGVCRLLNIEVSSEDPLCEFWFAGNAIRVHQKAEFEDVKRWIDLACPFRERSRVDRLMTLIGSVFLESVARATDRESEYKSYLDSLTPPHILDAILANKGPRA